jgi:hypothetical protein
MASFIAAANNSVAEAEEVSAALGPYPEGVGRGPVSSLTGLGAIASVGNPLERDRR